MKKILYENDNIIVTMTTTGEIDDDEWERKEKEIARRQREYAQAVEQLIADGPFDCMVLEDGDDDYVDKDVYSRQPVRALYIDLDRLSNTDRERIEKLVKARFPHNIEVSSESVPEPA